MIPWLWVAGAGLAGWFAKGHQSNAAMAKPIGDGYPAGLKAVDGTTIPVGSFLQGTTGLVQYPDGSIHQFK